jgi:hypothetical protein
MMIIFQVVFLLWALTKPSELNPMKFEIGEMDFILERGIS